MRQAPAYQVQLEPTNTNDILHAQGPDALPTARDSVLTPGQKQCSESLPEHCVHQSKRHAQPTLRQLVAADPLCQYKQESSRPGARLGFCSTKHNKILGSTVNKAKTEFQKHRKCAPTAPTRFS